MRLLLLLALPMMTLAPPLAAQQFEGSITVRIGEPGGTGSLLSRITTKGDKVLTVMALPGAAGRELRMITDNRAHKLTRLTPFPPGMKLPAGVSLAKGVIDVRDLPAQAKSPVAGSPKTDTRKLGTSQTIAGTRCDDYEATGETGQVVRMCLASSLGHLAFGALGEGGGNGPPEPWAGALGNKPLLPLKIWHPDGATVFEVVEIKRELVSPKVFDVPPGYIDIQTAMKNRTGMPKP